jgi:hypothetical protein
VPVEITSGKLFSVEVAAELIRCATICALQLASMGSSGAFLNGSRFVVILVPLQSPARSQRRDHSATGLCHGMHRVPLVILGSAHK